MGSTRSPVKDEVMADGLVRVVKVRSYKSGTLHSISKTVKGQVWIEDGGGMLWDTNADMGSVFYDQVANKAYIYDGTDWVRYHPMPEPVAPPVQTDVRVFGYPVYRDDTMGVNQVGAHPIEPALMVSGLSLGKLNAWQGRGRLDQELLDNLHAMRRELDFRVQQQRRKWRF